MTMPTPWPRHCCNVLRMLFLALSLVLFWSKYYVMFGHPFWSDCDSLKNGVACKYKQEYLERLDRCVNLRSSVRVHQILSLQRFNCKGPTRRKCCTVRFWNFSILFY